MNFKKERILLVGGGGFIGSYIAKKLEENGYSPVIYDIFLNNESFKEILRNKTEKIIVEKGDIRDRENLQKIFKKYEPEIVIHLAAISTAKECEKEKERAISVNIGGTLNILELLKESKSVKKFIYASSSFVYGDFLYFPADELHPTNPKEIYGITKLAAENLVKYLCNKYRINWTIIRPTAVYGPGDANRRVIRIFIENALSKKPVVVYNEGEETLDFTYITDVVEGFILCIFSDNSKNQIFNISRGEGRKISEVVKILKKIFPTLKVINKSKEIKTPLRGELSIKKANYLLGYKPVVSLEEGIQKYVKCLSEGKKL